MIPTASSQKTITANEMTITQPSQTAEGKAERTPERTLVPAQWQQETLRLYGDLSAEKEDSQKATELKSVAFLREEYKIEQESDCS